MAGDMAAHTFFITGTDTGVGKTVLTSLLVRQAQAMGTDVVALKPLCSGGREDAEQLHAAQAGRFALDAINPWHFRAPLTPLLAARREGKEVALRTVTPWLQTWRRKHALVLIEGAGGLLSPLGEGWDARALLVATRAVPLVVCPNRLGAVNQALLVFAALPKTVAASAKLVLMNPARPDAASRTNPALLVEMLGAERVHLLPHLPQWPWPPTRRLPARLAASLAGLLV